MQDGVVVVILTVFLADVTESGGGVCHAAAAAVPQLPRGGQPAVLHGRLQQRPLHVSHRGFPAVHVNVLIEKSI